MKEGVIDRRKMDAEEVIGLKTRHEQATVDPKALEEAVQNALNNYFPRREATANARTQFYNKFQREADEYDKDFVGKYNADLDTTLIFAGLFSAVTSAFIVAVQTQLQPDYNQLNYDILWAFADSTGLNSTGRIPTKPSSDSPWAGPDHGLVHIQVILLSSLAASLLAAFVAMLGKQWLNRYSRTDMHGSLVDRSRDRQRKIDGMDSWGFLLVMEGLPLILQAALLLLGCALSKYLFTINNLIAWVVLGFTAAGSIFYVFIVIAAIASYNCPFQTPLPLIFRFIINFDRKRTRYLKRSGKWFRRIFSNIKERLRQKPGRLPGTPDGNDAGDHLEIPMTGPSDRPLALFDEDTSREGYVLDANCIAWMFEMTMDPDVILDIMKFIPEIVWHRDIHNTPLEKLYGAVLECFDQSSGRPVMISKFKNKAYLAAKALAHVAIQRKCMGAESDKDLFDSISRKHKINWSLRCGKDHDLESTFGMIDLLFGPGNPTPMRWHEFSFSDSHHTWMNHILLYRAWDAFGRDEPLPDDVKEFALQYLRTKQPPPATTAMGYLRLIGLFLGIMPNADDQQATDMSHKFRTQIDRIYNKLDETFLDPDITIKGISRAIEAMTLITPLSEDIAARSYNLFRIIMRAHISRTYPQEKWEASRLALEGACGWSRVSLSVGNPEDILTFLNHHFDLATQHHENHDEPIENALRALSSTNDPVTAQTLANFDPTHPSFIRGIRYIFQPRRPLRLRGVALFFLPRIADRLFNAPRPVMDVNEMKAFSADWATTVDEIETDDIHTPALTVLFNMINSRHWRPYIVADKWKLLECALLYPDDSQHLERCLENPEVVDAISKGGNREAVVLWSKILLLRYKDLKDEVLQRFEVVVRSASREELGEYMSLVQSKQREAEDKLTDFTTWSTEPRAVALKEEIAGHKAAVKFLKSVRGNGR